MVLHVNGPSAILSTLLNFKRANKVLLKQNPCYHT